jgi:hypothetical protein
MRRLELLLLFGWTAVSAGLVFGDVEGPLRTWLALTWVSLVPGLALTGLIGVSGILLRLFMAVPVSLAMAAIVSGVLVYAGLPSWELGMSILVSLCIAMLILDLAPPRLAFNLAPGSTAEVRGKLADGHRQARLLDSLLAGATMAEAAEAAGISLSTLQRGLRQSDALRRAVEVAERTGYEDGDAERDSDGDVRTQTGENRNGGRRTRLPRPQRDSGGSGAR